MHQIVVDVAEPPLLVSFPTWQDVVRQSVYDSDRAFKCIAADLGMSPSLLSRRLGDDPTAHFPLDRLEDLVNATGDVRPVLWLCERFLTTAQQRDDQVRARLAQLLPEIERLTGQLQGETT